MKTRKQPGQRRQRKAGQRPSRRYEFLDHPADVGFIARGRTLTELFANAAQAMLDYGWHLSTVRPREKFALRATGHDLESLLYNWLAEILSRADAEGRVFKKVTVHRINLRRAPYAIEATAAGEPFVRGHHRGRTYIKAVTYHQLAVKKMRGGWPRTGSVRGWQATVYLDV